MCITIHYNSIGIMPVTYKSVSCEFLSPRFSGVALSKSLMLPHKRTIVQNCEARHRLEYGGSDLVNAKFDSDRAYGVRSGIKGNRGHTDGLDGVRSDNHCKLRKHPRYHATLHI